jgi:hypothetical protein
VGGKNGEIQPRTRVCKILEIADADDVGHSSSRTFGARSSLPVARRLVRDVSKFEHTWRERSSWRIGLMRPWEEGRR